jgi:hypothetical protein
VVAVSSTQSRLLLPDDYGVLVRRVRDLEAEVRKLKKAAVDGTGSGAYATIATVLSFDALENTASVDLNGTTITVPNYTGFPLEVDFLVSLVQLADGTQLAVGVKPSAPADNGFGLSFTYNGLTYRAAPSNWHGESLLNTRYGNFYLDGEVFPWATGAATTALVGASSTTNGRANTDLIVAQHGGSTAGYAAGVCKAYRGGGNRDWFLPSLDELTAMLQQLAPPPTIYQHTAAINGFQFEMGPEQQAIYARPLYWSSTEGVGTTAKAESLYRNDLDGYLKTGASPDVSIAGLPYTSLGAHIRPVRIAS